MSMRDILDGAIDRLRPDGDGAAVVDFAAVRRERDMDDPDSECARQCRCLLRAFRYLTAAYADGGAGAYRRAARRIKAIHDREFQNPLLLRVADVMRAHAEARGGPVPSPKLTITHVHDVGGQDIITFDLGGRWYWRLDRQVPRTKTHGPFDTEDDAVSDAIGELIYGDPS